MRPNSKEANGVGDYYNAYEIPLHEPMERMNVPRELLPMCQYEINADVAERQQNLDKVKMNKSGECCDYLPNNKWIKFLYLIIFLLSILFFGQSLYFFWLYYSRK